MDDDNILNDVSTPTALSNIWTGIFMVKDFVKDNPQLVQLAVIGVSGLMLFVYIQSSIEAGVLIPERVFWQSKIAETKEFNFQKVPVNIEVPVNNRGAVQIPSQGTLKEGESGCILMTGSNDLNKIPVTGLKNQVIDCVVVTPTIQNTEGIKNFSSYSEGLYLNWHGEWLRLSGNSDILNDAKALAYILKNHPGSFERSDIELAFYFIFKSSLTLQEFLLLIPPVSS